MTVKSLTRERGSLILEIWYENMTGQTMTLYSRNWWKGYAAGTYLLSEGGNRWLFSDDTQVVNRNGTDLITGKRLLNRITFLPEEEGTGSHFTYVGHYLLLWKKTEQQPYLQEEVEVVIQDIRANRNK